MRKLYLLLMLSGLLIAGAIAMPLETNQTEQAVRPDIVQTLHDLDLTSTAARIQDQRDARMTKIQSFPFPPFPGLCEGYEAPPGCTITFNDGQWCTQQCGLFLEVCDCVR